MYLNEMPHSNKEEGISRKNFGPGVGRNGAIWEKQGRYLDKEIISWFLFILLSGLLSFLPWVKALLFQSSRTLRQDLSHLILSDSAKFYKVPESEAICGQNQLWF